MLTVDPLWLEEPVLEEPEDLLTIPAIKRELMTEGRDDGLGLRSLVEWQIAPWPFLEAARPRVRALRKRSRGAQPTSSIAA